MAKELPYFKFAVADWLTGDIVYERYELQGLFINVCALYWQREGNLTVDDLIKRYKTELITELSGRFFSVNDGFISIKFLDEQFTERKLKSKINSKNGSLGGRPKQPKTLEKKANAKRNKSEPKANESNIEKKRKEKKILFTESNIFLKANFKDAFPEWTKEKLAYYYDTVLTWSNEGNKKIDWIATVKNWARRDELQGKINFNKPNQTTVLSGTL